VKVAARPLADAGVEARDVDEIVLGHFNAGFSAQISPLAGVQASPSCASTRQPRRERLRYRSAAVIGLTSPPRPRASCCGRRQQMTHAAGQNRA